MVKENGMVMMTDEEFKNVCKCYEKNIRDLQDEHEYETDLITNDYEKQIEKIQTELAQTKKAYEKRIELLQSALLSTTVNNKSVEGVQVTKTDFLAIYNTALNAMFKAEENGTLTDDNDIYGYDFTIHWHGIYCNCYDGAIPSNHIIPAIEGVNDEDPDEGWC